MTIWSKWLKGFLIFAMIAFLADGAVACTIQSPTEAVKETVDEVFSILQNSVFQEKERKAERGALLRKAIAARFDFREIAKRALGYHWGKQDGFRQDTFVALFTELIAAIYLDTIEQSIAVEVVYLREEVDDDYARVDTGVIPSGEDGIEVSYRLRMVDGVWKVYDVLVAHMSIVQNYRSQFYHILGRRTFDGLLEMMRKKIENLHRLPR